MKALGATIIHTKREDGMLGAAKKAQELLKTVENSVSLEQFKNMSNPLINAKNDFLYLYEGFKKFASKIKLDNFNLTNNKKYVIILTIPRKEGFMNYYRKEDDKLSMSFRLEVTPEEIDYSLDYFNITDDYGENEEEWL